LNPKNEYGNTFKLKKNLGNFLTRQIKTTSKSMQFHEN